MSRYAVIIAGGSGTRLWPMSREARPKQLLPLFAHRSLLQMTAERLEGLVPQSGRYICAAETHRAAILGSLPGFDDEHFLGEPEPRDTVNAVGLAAAVLARKDPAATFAVLTSDHLIEPQQEFLRGIELAFRLAESDPARLITFSIAPTHPATGYGYVMPGQPIAGFDGAFRTARFIEKPDARRAAEIIAAGGGWNSGMFVFPAGALLRAMSWYAPQSHAGLKEIAAAWSSPQRSATLSRIYPTLPRVSVDYAIMEPATGDSRLAVCTVPLRIAWMDVGSWASYAQTLPADVAGNRAAMPSDAPMPIHLDSSGVAAISDDPNHLIATVGCENLIIVHTKDATLVCRADQAEKVKELARAVDSKLR